jgi:hypothetical protein
VTAEVTAAEVVAALDEFERRLLAWLRRETRRHRGVELGPGKRESLVRECVAQYAVGVPDVVEAMRIEARRSFPT